MVDDTSIIFITPRHTFACCRTNADERKPNNYVEHVKNRRALYVNLRVIRYKDVCFDRSLVELMDVMYDSTCYADTNRVSGAG